MKRLVESCPFFILSMVLYFLTDVACVTQIVDLCDAVETNLTPIQEGIFSAVNHPLMLAFISMLLFLTSHFDKECVPSWLDKVGSVVIIVTCLLALAVTCAACVMP